MFSPNLSNRGKTVFVVGIVVVVSLFWLFTSRTSDSSSNSDGVDGEKQHSKESKMAEETVELHKDLNLFFPALPAEVEKKKEAVTVTKKMVEVDVRIHKYYYELMPFPFFLLVNQ